MTCDSLFSAFLFAQAPDRPNNPLPGRPLGDPEPDDEDEIPDVPPTEPPPAPIRDPRPDSQPPGPYVS